MSLVFTWSKGRALQHQHCSFKAKKAEKKKKKRTTFFLKLFVPYKYIQYFKNKYINLKEIARH